MNFAMLLRALGDKPVPPEDPTQVIVRDGQAEPDESTAGLRFLGEDLSTARPSDNRRPLVAQEQPKVTRVEEPQAAPPASRKSSGDSWDVLGALAAFTQNPMLADKVRRRDEAKYKDADLELARSREGRAARDSDFDFGRKQQRAPLEDEAFGLDVQAKRDRNASGAMELQSKRDSMDPTSPYAKFMKQGLAAQLNSFASTLAERGSPDARLYYDAAEMIEKNPSLTVQQAIDGVKPLADAAGFNLRALHDQAQEQMAKAHLSQGWAQIEASKENHQTQREQHAAEVEDRKNEKIPDGSQTTQYLDRREGLSKIARAKQLLKSGRIRYLGMGAGGLNTLMSAAPEALDKRNPEEREFANLIQWIAAPQRHELFGSSLTKGEKSVGDELFASISRNAPSVVQALNNMERGATRKTAEQEILYPGLSKLNARGAPAPRAGGVQPKAKGQPAPHGDVVKQNGHTFKWNGAEYVEVK